MSAVPKYYKRFIRPYKAFLQARYPAPDNLTNQQQATHWYHKAKATDFHWINGQPIPRRLANDLKDSIQRKLIPMSVDKAVKLRESTDSMKLHFNLNVFEPYTDNVLTKTISVNIRTKYDDEMFKLIRTIDRKFMLNLEKTRKKFIALGRPRQHDYKKHISTLNTLREWLTDIKGINMNPDGISGSDFDWWIDFSTATATLRPFGASRSGPAYNHPVANCALLVIKDAMSPITPKQEKIFEELQVKYQEGVIDTDYADIASKLKQRIKVTFAPSSEAAKVWLDQGKLTEDRLYAEFGKKTGKVIHVHHWANHATAMVQVPKHTYRYVDKKQMVLELESKYEQLYRTGEHSLTFRNKLNGEFETIQLKEVDGIQLELGKTSPQAQLYTHFKKQLVPYGYTDPNREQYDQFCKHGIHFSTGLESDSDLDFDLASAYSSYDTMPYYRGLPRDITYWVNNPTMEDIKSNSGFVLARFTDPIKEREITAWLACSAIDFLADNNLLHETFQAAFAHKTFNLDTSKYINPSKIHKRVFHKLLGLSSQIRSKKAFITADPIEAFDHNTAQISLPSYINSETVDASLFNHVSINVITELTTDRYSHVAATIQDNITVEVWRKWLEVKSINPNAVLITSLIDGFRIQRKGFDKSTFNYDNGRWAQKPPKAFRTSEQSDWKDEEFTRAKIAANELTRIDWSIKVKELYEDMLDVKKPDCLSFLDLAKEGYINCLQGYAGCGKSYNIRKLLEQFNACILTPTHSTREDMESYSIRNHLDDETLNTIPCFTYQSVIQRAGFLKNYQVIIIDEAGMLLAEHLNRIVEVAQRKLILLVGDPAQHKPIFGTKMLLEAKSIIFREHIESMPDLKEMYDNGSDWERNNMLTHLLYSSTFVAPEKTESESDEEYFDRCEQLKTEHADKKRDETKELTTKLQSQFDITTDRDVAAFDTFECTKFLDVVKRADDSDDGRALVELCKDVRERGLTAIKEFVSKNPQYKSDNASDSDAVISYRNSTVIQNNLEHEVQLYEQCNKEATDKQLESFNAKYEDTATTDLEKEELELKTRFALVDIDIPIIATGTFSRKIDGKSVKFYNGTRGTIRNFVVSLNGHEMPYTEIVTPQRKTKTNPFKKPTLTVCPITMMHAITSHRAQGRTISDGTIFIDCDFVSNEMLYVAVSRARRLSQLRFAFSDTPFSLKPRKQPKLIKVEPVELPFKLPSSKTILAKKSFKLSSSA
jgi:hypothetical protein